MKKRIGRGRGLNSTVKTSALTGAGSAVAATLIFEGGKWVYKKTRGAKAPNPTADAVG